MPENKGKQAKETDDNSVNERPIVENSEKKKNEV